MKLIIETPIYDQIVAALQAAYRAGQNVTAIELTKEERHRLYASTGSHRTHIHSLQFGSLPIVKAEAEL